MWLMTNFLFWDIVPESPIHKQGVCSVMIIY